MFYHLDPPDNVNLTLHPAREQTLLCTEDGNYNRVINVTWTVNGKCIFKILSYIPFFSFQVNGEIQPVNDNELTVSNISDQANVTCKFCIEFYDKTSNCYTSPIFQYNNGSLFFY